MNSVSLDTTAAVLVNLNEIGSLGALYAHLNFRGKLHTGASPTDVRLSNFLLRVCPGSSCA